MNILATRITAVLLAALAPAALAGEPVEDLRRKLHDRGVTVGASLTADYSVNFRGGVSTNGDTFRHLLDLCMTFDLHTLFDLPGATLFVDFQTKEGDDGSADTGDYQVYSNIDGEDFTAVYELWYEQCWLDDRLRVKLGKVDANSEFAFVEHGGDFIHSSPGFSPTILGLPTYQDPAMSVNLFVHPNDDWYAGVGLYDGAAQEGFPTGRRGPSTAFGEPADLFVIGEVGRTWTLHGERPGRVGAGAWLHTGTFETWSGGMDHGTHGLHLVLDQLIWREGQDDQGIGIFFQAGFADEDVAEADIHLGAGAAWTGLIPSRDSDVAGLMASWVHFSDSARDAGEFHESYELAVELFYKVQVTSWLAVQPDLQCIIHPGGQEDARTALVGTIRVVAEF